MFSPGRLRDLLRRFLHLQDSPQRTALAFSVGVFIAFSPSYGLHTASVFLCAWAFRLNFIAVLTGSLINNPWTVVPILAGTMWVGLLAVPGESPPPINWEHFTFLTLWEQLQPFIVPFVTGALLLGTIAALLAYPLVYLAIVRFRRRRV